MTTGDPWNYEDMKRHLEVSSVYGRPYAVIGHNGGTPEVVDACPENEPYNEVYFIPKDDYARLLAKKKQCKILAQIIADHEANGHKLYLSSWDCFNDPGYICNLYLEIKKCYTG